MTQGSSSTDASFIAEALPTFISEACEQVEAIEQLLLKIEETPDDRDLLDALFRCAHTVKGSAGIFGLDLIVEFTHHVETLLDRLREGKVVFTPELGTLLLECNDEIRALVAAADGTQPEPEGASAARAALVQRLQAITGVDGPVAQTKVSHGPTAETPGPAARPHRWHISATFGRDTFSNGMDPLAILNYLRSLGQVVSIACDVAAIPALEDINPEACYLAFGIGLDSEANRETIESAFSFVREDCLLHILDPEARAEDYIALIEAMPDCPRLGEILVSVGAVTHDDIDQSLRRQAARAATEGHTPPLGEILQQHAGVSSKVVEAALQKQQKHREAGGTPGEESRFIRVQADRLDAVINLLGELVIASAGASLLAQHTRQRALTEANLQVVRLIEEIRNGTLQLRMVPIGETFARFRRVVRDTAGKLGKDVVLEVLGGDTEMDKSVVERIADPLMHLVRNALDHGLETPAEREAAGKPAQGRLVLKASHESGSVLIRISDDGRGIDRQKVLKRAWDRGLVEQGKVPTDDEILNLIFEPGFSTAEAVTSLSGRGVGMDVVLRNIEALRGTVKVRSEVGVGTTIEIRLPLTLAIIDGFLVGVASSKFVFPLETVVEVIENQPATTTPDSRGRCIVELRGQVLPVVDLRTLYSLDGPAPSRASVVVIQAAERRFGVLVDQLLGQHQTVIKPLGRLFRSLRGMSGSSILGTGEVALIFDAPALGELAADSLPAACVSSHAQIS